MNASGRIAAHLRQDILSGRLTPGSWLRQEEVAERLGVSRLPVREALHMLVAEGLAELEPNRGSRVVLLDARQVELLYRMRERLEPLALAESAPRLTADDLAALHQLQHRIEEGSDVSEFVDLDRAFHLLTYSRCEMEPLTSVVTRLWNSTQYYRRRYVELIGPERRWVVDAEHRLLLEALGRSDAAVAGLCLEGHIRRTRVELGRHPEIFP